MPATIKNVADYAGVSFKTVSRVLNNEGQVRPATEKKVKDAIQALNYQPNKAARDLAGRESFVLSFVYDNPNAYYILDMQQGVLNGCRSSGYELLIHPCRASSPNIVAEIEAMIDGSRPAGIILSPPFSEMPVILEALDNKKIPFVRVLSGRDSHSLSSPCVLVNDFQAARDITEHLIMQGHQHIAFIAGDKEHKSTAERCEGYQYALKNAGIPLNQKLIMEGSYSFKAGVASFNKLFALTQPPSAVFACNDEIAAGVLFAASAAKVSVPKELAIAGFEDSPFSTQTFPPLTTASQPTVAIAQQATELLLQLLLARRRKERYTGSHSKTFLPKLVVRKSTLG